MLRCTTSQPGSWASVPRSSSASLTEADRGVMAQLGERDGIGRIAEGLGPPSRAGDAEVEGGPECLVPIDTHSESAHVVGETEDGSVAIAETAVSHNQGANTARPGGAGVTAHNHWKPRRKYSDSHAGPKAPAPL